MKTDGLIKVGHTHTYARIGILLLSRTPTRPASSPRKLLTRPADQACSYPPRSALSNLSVGARSPSSGMNDVPPEYSFYSSAFRKISDDAHENDFETSSQYSISIFDSRLCKRSKRVYVCFPVTIWSLLRRNVFRTCSDETCDSLGPYSRLFPESRHESLNDRLDYFGSYFVEKWKGLCVHSSFKTASLVSLDTRYMISEEVWACFLHSGRLVFVGSLLRALYPFDRSPRPNLTYPNLPDNMHSLKAPIWHFKDVLHSYNIFKMS